RRILRQLVNLHPNPPPLVDHRQIAWGNAEPRGCTQDRILLLCRRSRHLRTTPPGIPRLVPDTRKVLLVSPLKDIQSYRRRLDDHREARKLVVKIEPRPSIGSESQASRSIRSSRG